MQDRRDPSRTTPPPGPSRWNERRFRRMERRHHPTSYRLIHIDVLNLWRYLASAWRRATRGRREAVR